LTPSARVPDVDLELSRSDVEALLAVAHHYERVMGLARHIVVATSPGRIKRRYRYIVAESDALARRAEEWLTRFDEAADPAVLVRVPISDVVALWGRVLSSLNTKRSRRKLSKAMIADQEHASSLLEVALASLWADNHGDVASEIETRRGREREWMLAALTGEGVVH
jgi:hypothetical protein